VLFSARPDGRKFHKFIPNSPFFAESKKICSYENLCSYVLRNHPFAPHKKHVLMEDFYSYVLKMNELSLKPTQEGSVQAMEHDIGARSSPVAFVSITATRCGVRT